jgi:transposase
MFTPPYLPCTAEFALDDVSYRGDEALAILAHASPSTADCPSCGRSSYRVHSRYQRRVADLPIQGMPVKFHMTVRRFRCRTIGCHRRIFSERFQMTMGHYARETQRRNATLENVAFALGGKPAERITHVLGMPTSNSTLLRRIRRSPCTAETSAQVIGIDDFAFKKGNTYGTIIVNHQSGRPMDMLPDREAQTVEKWAREHPEIEIVSRDRSGAYKSGIDAGAPQAVQVADRFHLLVNAREALQRVVERKSSALVQAAHSIITPEQDDTPPDMKAVTRISGKAKNPRAQALSACRRERRYQRYFEVVQLRAQGISISGIARALRISRMTIRCWLRAGSFPERAPRRPITRRRSIRPYETYLLQRISEGMRTGTLLYQEIRDRGFRGSYRTVRRWASDQGVRQPCSKANSVAIPAEWRSPRAVTWLLIKRSDELSEQDGRFVTALLECDTVIAAARESVSDFVRIVRERDHAKLDSWIEKAKKTELGGFVDCIEQDHDIIDAALRLPWSNGPVEGHVNRIKAIKRQMYGRANFDLLRRRVLHVA